MFNSDDPDAAFDSLTASEQQAVAHFINGTGTTSSDVMIGMAMGANSDYDCRIHRYTAVKTSLGIKLASYISSTDFCYDGDYIVGTPYVYATGRVHFPGWVFLGNISAVGGLGPNNEWHKDRAEGSFRACPQWFCQGWRPVIHKKQYGSGAGWGWED